MNILRILHLLPLFLIATAGAEDIPLPNPPAGQVLDRSDWLSEDDTRHLESELSRLRGQHHIDILVVIWDHSLPTDHDLDSFARRLGETWAREELWAVVLQVPDSVNRPAVTYGGATIDNLRSEAVEAAVQSAIGRGMKEWTARTQTRGVTLNLAEELVYLRLRRQHELAIIQQTRADALAATQQQKRTRLIRIALGVTAILLLLGILVAVRVLIRRRSPSELVFPETRWRRRLGAAWSGGSDIVTTFTPPEPK